MINALLFYYGAALVSYQPMSGINPAPIDLTQSQDIIMCAQSQRPHIWLYPQTSQGGSMILPFIYNNNAVNLTSSADVQSLGRLTLRSIVPLDNANSVVGTGATIRVYAYASQVKLGGPTFRAALQSGIISGPASAVANISKSLESVPIIGKWARATTIGASAVSGIASLFGFTDVPVIRDVEPLKNLPFHSLTSAHIGEPVTKLSLDPKNEVSIDTSILGTKSEDELTISKFVDRYAIVGVATWTASSAPDALLWAASVTPKTFIKTVDSVRNQYVYQTVPMGVVAELFQYWRGPITYKITALASKFHRGRYVVTWDPVADISANQSYVGTCYTKVVDIAEETEIEITIPYMQPSPFQTCSINTLNYDTQGPTYPTFATGNNGILTIRVFTQQTSPVATADIKLVVSVKGHPELEFAVPKSINGGMSPFSFQSGEMTMDTRSSVELTNEHMALDKERYLISFGEPFRSLRSLMRRATLVYSDVLPYPTTATDTLVTYVAQRSVFPVSPGFDPNGFSVATKYVGATNANYNWCNYSPIAFISQCFVGRRGSIIHHLNINAGKTPMGYLSASYVFGSHSSSSWSGSSSITTTSSVNALTKNSLTNLDSGASGCDMTNGFVQPAMSVMIPHNTPSKFMNTNPAYSVAGITQDSTHIMALKFCYVSRDAGLTQVADYIQIGTDYSLCMFLNVPTLYVTFTSPPAP